MKWEQWMVSPAPGAKYEALCLITSVWDESGNPGSSRLFSSRQIDGQITREHAQFLGTEETLRLILTSVCFSQTRGLSDSPALPCYLVCVGHRQASPSSTVCPKSRMMPCASKPSFKSSPQKYIGLLQVNWEDREAGVVKLVQGQTAELGCNPGILGLPHGLSWLLIWARHGPQASSTWGSWQRYTLW